MASETTIQFLQKLAQKSEEGAVPWEVTSEKEIFVVGLSNLTVTVSR